MSPRLGVNIDHVATIRQARGMNYPSLIEAAKQSINSGADQITIHLRADRRHIQDSDVLPLIKLCHQMHSLLNLEISCDPQMINLACHYQPDWICLVPETPQERTTEGGLNLKNPQVHQSVMNAIEKIKNLSPKTKISLFIAADITIQKILETLPIDAIEIHTGDYAHHFPQMHNDLKMIHDFMLAVKESKFNLHAGHGLTIESIKPLLNLRLIEEYNIGHWIIADSIFSGLNTVVKNLKNLILQYPLNKMR